jgi:RNA polymerase sigma-70 factor (ECF subfamily)
MKDIQANNKSGIDENLFEKIAQGDNEAFTELYYVSYKQIYGFLLSLTRNKEDAEDLLQNTYIRIRNGSHLYKKQGTPMTWMCAIAKNQYLDFVRKYGKNRNVDFGEVENYVSEGIASKTDDTKSIEDKMLLEKAFDVLGEQERAIVVLHMINGLKHREISELTGLPLSTVLSKYNRSLKKMKEIIGE